MTIDEVIRHLDYLQYSTSTYITEDDRKALGLGIEAIKRLKVYREWHRPTADEPLDGETEE